MNEVVWNCLAIYGIVSLVTTLAAVVAVTAYVVCVTREIDLNNELRKQSIENEEKRRREEQAPSINH